MTGVIGQILDMRQAERRVSARGFLIVHRKAVI